MNEVIHFDLCYVMLGTNEILYFLVIKDEFSGYVWLIPDAEADSETTTDALLKWLSKFGIAHRWVSEKGSQFKNQVI